MERARQKIQGENPMSNEIILYKPSELREMAKDMARLFQKTPEDLFALMLIAQAENKHPAIAAQEYDIIKGRPALKSQATLARFQAAGGTIRWITRDDTKATANFTHPKGGELTVTWTIERAKKAGLTGKDNWQQYPAQMLSSRVVAEGVRAIYPACLSGFYTSDEVQDIDSPRQPQAEPEQMAPAEKPKAKTIKKESPEAVEDVPSEPAEKPQEVPAEYMERRQEIIKEVAAIVGAKDNPDSWSQDEKDMIGTKSLMDESKQTLDIAPMETLLLRAKIGQIVHRQPAWTATMNEVVAMGNDQEALNSALLALQNLAATPEQNKGPEIGQLVGQDLELY
jgi:hypothetical protein